MRKHTVSLVLVAILVLAVSGCAPTPAPPTKAILEGRVVVPEGVGEQALAGATVRVKDLEGNIVATTTTDANGNYQVEVPPGGPYIVEVVKGSIKVLDVSPQVEAGEAYDLGTADATSTAVALVFQAKVEAGEDPAEIDLEELAEDPKIGNLIEAVEEALAAGKDPTTAPEVIQIVEVIVTPPKPAPKPTPEPVTYYTLTLTGEGLTSVPPAGKIAAGTKVTITVTPPAGKQVATFTVNGVDKKAELVNNKYTFTITADTTVVVTYILTHSTYKFTYTVPEEITAGEEITIPVTFKTDVLGKDGYSGVRFQFEATGPDEGATVTFKATDSLGNPYTAINNGYWGPEGGFDLPAEYSATTEWKLTFSAAGTYTITFRLIDAATGAKIDDIEDSVTVEVAVKIIYKEFGIQSNFWVHQLHFWVEDNTFAKAPDGFRFSHPLKEEYSSWSASTWQGFLSGDKKYARAWGDPVYPFGMTGEDKSKFHWTMYFPDIGKDFTFYIGVCGSDTQEPPSNGFEHDMTSLGLTEAKYTASTGKWSFSSIVYDEEQFPIPETIE